MFVPKQPIPPEPEDRDKIVDGDIIYLPKHPDIPDTIDSIYQVWGEEAMTFRLVSPSGASLKTIYKTDYLDIWFTQAYYDWAMQIFGDYGYLLGWCILSHRYPNYNHFFIQILKTECKEVWLIVKNKTVRKQQSSEKNGRSKIIIKRIK